jgi:hypothetical protein
MTVLLWTLLAMLCYAGGEYASKRYALHPAWAFYWLAVLFYWSTTLTWMPVIRRTNTLAVSSTIWNICYFVISIALGVLVFHEKLTSQQVVGLVFGAIAVVLLSS